MAFLARFVLTITILAATTFVHAKTFDLNLYLFKPESNLAIRNNFFLDYYHYARCDVEIDDTNIAAVVNTSYPFINVRSSGFKRFNCDIKGKDRTYSFEFGSDVAMPDFWDESGFPQQNYGLLFGTDGKPILFDSEGTFGGVWWYDSPWDFDFFFKYHSWWGPIVDDKYQTPLAVFLEPFTIGGIEYPKGTFRWGPNFPEGLKFARIGGQFSFEEQAVSDDGKTIQSPLKATGYYTFDEKLSVPKVRITQAVFEDVPVQKLVHKRTTAIIIDKGEFFGDRELEIKITRKSDEAVVFTASTKNHPEQFEPGDEPNQVIFYCNQSNAYCSLDLAESGIDEKQNSQVYEVSVGYADYLPVLNTVNVGATLRSFVISFVIVATPICDAGSCGISLYDPSNLKSASVTFLQSIFPLSDGSVKNADLFDEPIPPSAIAEEECADTSCGKLCNIKLKAIYDDIYKLQTLSRNMEVNRTIGVVPPDYFSSKGIPRVQGLSLPEIKKSVLIRSDSNSEVIAHEFGHTYSLGEGYTTDNNCTVTFDGEYTYGFNVYQDSEIQSGFTSGVDIMGTGPEPKWIGSQTWNHLYTAISKMEPDPQILIVNATVSKDGNVNLGRWIEYTGRPDSDSAGEYSVNIYDKDQNIIQKLNFGLSFTVYAHPFGKLSTESSPIAIAINYPQNAHTLKILGPNGEAIVSIDPVVKVMEDDLSDIPSECIAETKRNELLHLTESLKLSIEIGSTLEIKKNLFDFQSIFQSGSQFNCNTSSSYYRNSNDITKHILQDIERIKNRHGIQSLYPDGDLDHDGDVDQNDLNIITAARNKPADGANDPRDLDADGKITALDARKLTQLCTRPRCTTN